LAASFIRYQNNRELYAITDASLEFLFLLFQDKRKDKILIISMIKKWRKSSEPGERELGDL
jgi:hypothetical protein